jgi:hypothetical protein
MGGTAGIRGLQSFDPAVAGRGGATLRVIEGPYFIHRGVRSRFAPSALWQIQIGHFPLDGIGGEIDAPGP